MTFAKRLVICGFVETRLTFIIVNEACPKLSVLNEALFLSIIFFMSQPPLSSALKPISTMFFSVVRRHCGVFLIQPFECSQVILYY